MRTRFFFLTRVLVQSAPGEASQPPVDFSDLLSSSIVRDMTYKATCQTCKTLTTFRSRRELPGELLPPLLAVNTSVNTEDHLRIWRDSRVGVDQRRFLKPRVQVRCSSDRGLVSEVVEYEVRVSSFVFFWPFFSYICSALPLLNWWIRSLVAHFVCRLWWLRSEKSNSPPISCPSSTCQEALRVQNLTPGISSMILWLT